jgi:hypothetical protein
VAVTRFPLVVEHKAASAVTGTAAGAVLDKDEDRVFTVLAAVTGIKDAVNDVLLPGVFERTLTKRRPKVIKDHDWPSRLGTVPQIKELRPGDPGLPAQLPNGDPWPPEAGALIGKVRLFTSPEGKQAAERWREDHEQQFSIGYITRKALKRKSDGVRLLADVDLLEISDVLWGAMPLCGTLPGELATKMLPAAEGKDAPGETLVSEADDEAAVQAALDELDAEDVADVVRIPDDPGEDDSGDDPPDPADDASRTGPDLDGAGDPASELASDVVVAVNAEGKRALSTEKRKKVPTLPGSDTRFPIEKPEDVKAAIRAYGRAKPQDKPRVKAWIIKRAKELGAVNLLPEAWRKASSQVKGIDALLTLDDDGFLALAGKAESPVPHPGGAAPLKRWYVTGEGAAKIRWGTPGDLTRCHNLAVKHMTSEQAWGFCQERHKDALGTSNSPTKQLPAAVSPATYDASEAKAGYDPTLERGDLAGWQPVRRLSDVLDVKDYPRFPGTLEERMEAVRSAVWKRLRGPKLDADDTVKYDRYRWDHVMLDATWMDRVIATRMNWSAGDAEERETFEIGYLWDGTNVTLGEPVPVRLQVTATALGGETGASYEDPLAIATVIAVKDLAARLPVLGTVETKVGRVLSSANATRLRDALQHLMAVASAAGLDVHPVGEQHLPEKENGQVDPQTTAPAAQTKTLTIPKTELDDLLGRLAAATS